MCRAEEIMTRKVKRVNGVEISFFSFNCTIFFSVYKVKIWIRITDLFYTYNLPI